MKIHSFVRFTPLIALAAAALDASGQAGQRPSLAGEEAARRLQNSARPDDYHFRLGSSLFQTEASVGISYNDNIYRAYTDTRDDVSVSPEVKLRGWVPVTELNSLRFSLGLGYQWYAKNSQLNSDSPLIHPDSELSFHLFAGAVHLELHDRFGYQESLLMSRFDRNETFFNFNNVGKFAYLNNRAGFKLDWDLNQVILTAAYDHDIFESYTGRFDYLDRGSELVELRAAYVFDSGAQAGLESKGGYHDYQVGTPLNDHWRARVGPFVEFMFRDGISVRLGAGYDTARFSQGLGAGNDFDTYYAYGQLNQRLRWFAHSLAVGRESELGNNANNLKQTYLRYSLTTGAIRHVELRAYGSVNFAEEFGGTYSEEFDYYRIGVSAGYQFHKYWRTDLGYSVTLKSSELTQADMVQNQVTLSLAFRF